jgi:predicted TIM-barrel fold metal-dependent hydrolase
MKAISVDDHVIEHPKVWTDRLSSKWGDAIPHIVELENGSEQWCFEGIVQGMTGLSAVAGTPLKERALDPGRFDEMRPGAYDPIARLEDMDLDGVEMHLLFPNWSGFAGSRFYRANDKALASECIKAYNDFLIEEWYAVAPTRYIPMMLVPVWDADECITEIERNAAREFRAIAFPDNPALIGLPSWHTDHWDGVLSAAEAAQTPLCMHFGGSGGTPTISKDAPLAVATSLMGSTLFHSMADIMLSPTLHKHPNLKIAYSEGQIGWMPYALQRIDQVWEHYRFYDIEPTINAEVRPSDLFRQHIYGCFIDDMVGVEMRHSIGVDNILWEADYPHADSVFPNSRTNLAKMLAGVPDDECHKIAELNARKLFRL